MAEVLYFGAVGGPGHHLIDTQMRSLPIADRAWLQRLDGGYAPRCMCPSDRWGGAQWCSSPERCQPQGVARLTHESGRTYLSMWDRTGDRRYGSHSTFVIEGELCADAAQEAALAAFPAIYRRIQSETPILMEAEVAAPRGGGRYG